MAMMSAQNLDLALRRGAPLEAPERWILEALCAAGDEFVTFSTLQSVSGVRNGHFYRAWGALLQRLYAACGCRVCRSKSRDKVYHVFDGLRLAEAEEWSFRLPGPLREVVAEWLANEVAREAQLQLQGAPASPLGAQRRDARNPEDTTSGPVARNGGRPDLRRRRR